MGGATNTGLEMIRGPTNATPTGAQGRFHPQPQPGPPQPQPTRATFHPQPQRAPLHPQPQPGPPQPQRGPPQPQRTSSVSAPPSPNKLSVSAAFLSFRSSLIVSSDRPIAVQTSRLATPSAITQLPRIMSSSSSVAKS